MSDTLTDQSQAGTSAHSFSAAESRVAAQMRLRVLSDLESTVAHLSRTIPKSFALTFETQPTSLVEPAPEPKEAKFQGYLRWLLDQRQYVSHDLQPIGDGDMDGRRDAMIKRLDGEIRRLDNMKEKAWSKYAVDVLIRARFGMGVGAGPVPVILGIVTCCGFAA